MRGALYTVLAVGLLVLSAPLLGTGAWEFRALQVLLQTKFDSVPGHSALVYVLSLIHI